MSTPTLPLPPDAPPPTTLEKALLRKRRVIARLDGSPRHAIHDGDTIRVIPEGFSKGVAVRMLGMDAAEMTYQIAHRGGWPRTDAPSWDALLTDPFADRYPPMRPTIDAALRAYLRARLGPTAADNHRRHAEAARANLIRMVEDDMARAKKGRFKFYIAFARERMDRRGRILGYIAPFAEGTQAQIPTYNERQIASAFALPLFIWPNVDPFVRGRVALGPKKLRAKLATALKLQTARTAFRDARGRSLGVFNVDDPLRIAGHEARYIADREPRKRWVIDLSADDNKLIHPLRYFTVPDEENRLYVEDADTRRFVSAGWKKLEP
jgi:hypothetical protein